MTEDLKKVYNWNPADGDYQKDDAMESTIAMQKELRKTNLISFIAVVLSAILLIGSLIYFT